MSTVTINRGEKVAIPFTIVDANGSLGGKRVTWAVSPTLKVVSGVPQVHLATAVLKKVGGLPGSSADITITTQTSTNIVGTINLSVADYITLTDRKYSATLWVDSGASDDRVVSASGYDDLVIQETSPRT